MAEAVVINTDQTLFGQERKTGLRDKPPVVAMETVPSTLLRTELYCCI